MNDTTNDSGNDANPPVNDGGNNDANEMNTEMNTGSDPQSHPRTLRPAHHHHTHTLALVLLSLLTLAIVIAVVIIGTGTPIIEDPDSDTATSTTDAPVEDGSTPGSLVPVSYPEATEVENIDGMPEGIPVDQAGIVSNSSSEFGPDYTQRIVTYNSGDSVEVLAERYRNWLSESNFALTDEAVSDTQPATSASLRSERGEERLQIAIMSPEDSSETRVQLNYIVPN